MGWTITVRQRRLQAEIAHNRQQYKYAGRAVLAIIAIHAYEVIGCVLLYGVDRVESMHSSRAIDAFFVQPNSTKLDYLQAHQRISKLCQQYMNLNPNDVLPIVNVL